MLPRPIHLQNEMTQSFALHELRWSAAIEGGIAEIDAQHRRLFEIFNAAVRAQAAGVGRVEIQTLLADLLDYTQGHFRNEADLMRRWPIDAAHKSMHLAAHERFATFLSKALALHAEQPADIALDLLAYLAQWLLHHVAVVDLQLAREVRALEVASNDSVIAVRSIDETQLRVADTLGQLLDSLVQRTFDLLHQREQLSNLQKLYRALLHSGDVLIQSRSEQEMLDSLCSKIVHETPFHAAWIGRPRADAELFEVLAMFGEGTRQVDEARPRLTSEYRSSMTVRAWTGQQLLYSNDTLADPILAHWHDGLARHRWLSALAAPIMRGGTIWAVLTLASPQRGTFDEQTVEVCSRIATHLGRGLDEFDLKANIQSLRNAQALLARTDPLTGLPNRLALDEYLDAAIRRAQLTRRALAVGLVDLDDFKAVNDSRGHDAGDAVLREFVQRVRDAIRAGDFFARLGGDEFVMVFEAVEDGTLIESSLPRLHAAVQTPYALPKGDAVGVGMSLGLAVHPRDGLTSRDLLRHADAAMYQAKLRRKGSPEWFRFASTTR